jgi:hypothetical protein
MMDGSNDNITPDAKLLIEFPKSQEDHRLQLVVINGSIFAIVHSPLESLGPIVLNCEEWSLIILAPIKSKTNILISAINIICLNEIESEEGNVSVHATNQLVKLGNLFKPHGKVCEMGEGGEFQFNDDLGALMHYHRLFHSIVSSARTATPESFSEAQQKFIMSLCSLADKMEGGADNLDLQKVLSLWKIPYLE